MKKQLNQVLEFHKKFEIPYRTSFNEEGLNVELRKTLLEEELKEWYDSAVHKEGIENRAKELADNLYIIYGTIITEGLQDVIEQVFDEVHISNMSKLGDDGKPVRREDGKVIKGENYKAPDLKWLKIIK